VLFVYMWRDGAAGRALNEQSRANVKSPAVLLLHSNSRAYKPRARADLGPAESTRIVHAHGYLGTLWCQPRKICIGQRQ